jgi:hypothetical protein
LSGGGAVLRAAMIENSANENGAEKSQSKIQNSSVIMFIGHFYIKSFPYPVADCRLANVKSTASKFC